MTTIMIERRCSAVYVEVDVLLAVTSDPLSRILGGRLHLYWLYLEFDIGCGIYM
jgi:hypothetical protein